MDKEEFINIFILKSVLRDNRLTFLERLLLIHIISLCKRNGYCKPILNRIKFGSIPAANNASSFSWR